MHLDIFKDDAFSLSQLTAAVQSALYQPGRLGQMGLFGTPEGVTTTSVTIEFQNDVMSIIPVSQRGAPATQSEHKNRTIDSFTIPHIKREDSLIADQILGIRAFGSESELEVAAKVVGQRLTKLKRDVEYTKESHRMLALKGYTVDAFGNNVNLFTRFGVSQDNLPFDLDSATFSVRAATLDLLTSIEDSLGGLSFTGVRVLCGSVFWKKLIEHKSVKESYLATEAASTLRGDPRTEFTFANVTWERYRGTSDVKIEDTEAFAVPEGVVDLFIARNAPADYIETVNTLGQEIYAKQWAMEADRGIKMEVQANPLHLCTRPKAVKKLHVGAT